MGWIDRINAAIVRRIARKDSLLADEHGIEQSQFATYSESERWALITRGASVSPARMSASLPTTY